MIIITSYWIVSSHDYIRCSITMPSVCRQNYCKKLVKITFADKRKVLRFSTVHVEFRINFKLDLKKCPKFFCFSNFSLKKTIQYGLKGSRNIQNFALLNDDCFFDNLHFLCMIVESFWFINSECILQLNFIKFN